MKKKKKKWGSIFHEKKYFFCREKVTPYGGQFFMGVDFSYYTYEKICKPLPKMPVREWPGFLDVFAVFLRISKYFVMYHAKNRKIIQIFIIFRTCSSFRTTDELNLMVLYITANRKYDKKIIMMSCT